jgi:hypothetical protein
MNFEFEVQGHPALSYFTLRYIQAGISETSEQFGWSEPVNRPLQIVALG